MANLVVTGNSTSVTEYLETISIIVEVTSNTQAGDDTVQSITIVPGLHSTGANISYSSNNANIGYITGTYNNVFPKTVTYLDSNRVSQTISSFDQLPKDFFLLSGYSPSPSRSETAIYYVYANFTSNGNVFMGSVSQTVINNYTTGRNALQESVPKGQF